jgi:hypothetical protein
MWERAQEDVKSKASTVSICPFDHSFIRLAYSYIRTSFGVLCSFQAKPTINTVKANFLPFALSSQSLLFPQEKEVSMNQLLKFYKNKLSSNVLLIDFLILVAKLL